MDKDTIITVDNDKYVLDVKFKNIIKDLIDNTKDINIETQIKMVRCCLSSKFNIKTSSYRERKLIDNMLKIFFDEKILFDIFVKPVYESQKKYHKRIRDKEKEQ